ncbi:MAG: chemotaxis protein CheA [Planctomycetota bacterium]
MVDQSELIDDFTNETSELLELLEAAVVELEKKTYDDELINSIFRYVHTIKGTSSFLGLSNISKAAHLAETALDRLRKKKLDVSRDVIDLILKFIDSGRGFLQYLYEGRSEEYDFNDLITVATDLLEKNDRASARQTRATQAPSLPPSQPEPSDDIIDLSALLDGAPQVKPTLVLPWESAKSGTAAKTTSPADAQTSNAIPAPDVKRKGTQTVRLPFTMPPSGPPSKSGVKIWINPQLTTKGSSDKSKTRELFKETALLPANADDARVPPKNSSDAPDDETADDDREPIGKKSLLTRRRGSPPPSESTSASSAGFLNRTTIRVDLKRIDSIVNHVVELVTQQHRLRENIATLKKEENTELARELELISGKLTTITVDLYESIMKVRMVPLATLFSRFPRLVRDLDNSEGKPLRLHTDGEETELDKTIAESIADPLVHIIRNAAAHGIETPADREKAGKPRIGTISLSAHSHGDQVLIIVEDDGRGIDPEVIGRLAVEKGLITTEQRRRMDEREIYNILFIPGFSTKQSVDGVSGRGVGMDVVKSNVTNVGGAVQVESVLGKGTTITLRLPLTLAILRALNVAVDDNTFSIPLRAVRKTIRLSENDLEYLQGRWVFRDLDGVIPVMDLSKALGFGSNGSNRNFLVIVFGAGRRFGLTVDSVISQDSIVAKQLSPVIGLTPGISGATITGAGATRLIIDVNMLAPKTWND